MLSWRCVKRHIYGTTPAPRIRDEFAAKPDAHTYCIGRTGCAGAPGLAIALIVRTDVEKLRLREAAARASGGAIERLPVPEFSTGRAALVSAAAAAAPDVGTLFVSGGRKDKLRPADLLGALTGEAGLTAADIGRIEIHDRFSWVALSEPVLRKLLATNRTLRVKNRNFRVERVQ